MSQGLCHTVKSLAFVALSLCEQKATVCTTCLVIVLTILSPYISRCIWILIEFPYPDPDYQNFLIPLPKCATTVLTGEDVRDSGCAVHISLTSEHLKRWLPTMFSAEQGFRRSPGLVIQRSSRLHNWKKGLLFSQIRGFGRVLWNSSLFPSERDDRDGPINSKIKVLCFWGFTTKLSHICLCAGEKIGVRKQKKDFPGIGRGTFYCVKQVGVFLSHGIYQKYDSHISFKAHNVYLKDYKKQELLCRDHAWTVKNSLVSVLKMLSQRVFTS